MAVMMGKLYAALKEAGAPEDIAREAAEEAAEFRESLNDLRSTLRVHTWMLTFNTALILATLGLVVRILFALPHPPTA